MATRDEIYELALHNPAVHMAVKAYISGFVSWEDAMMELVVILERQNKDQFELLQEMTNRSFQPSVFVKKFIEKG